MVDLNAVANCAIFRFRQDISPSKFVQTPLALKQAQTPGGCPKRKSAPVTPLGFRQLNFDQPPPSLEEDAGSVVFLMKFSRI